MAKGKYEGWLTDEGLLKLEGWARDGLTDEQIAENIGIVPSTLYEWKKRYSEISEALKKGKEVIDRQVENKLLQRALGYSYTEDEYAVYQLTDEEYFDELEKHIKLFKLNNPEATDNDIEKERISFPALKKQLIKQKTKEVIPDTTAQIFWLKNRKPKEWRDKQEHEHSGGIDVRKQYENMSDEELEKLVKRYEKINKN